MRTMGAQVCNSILDIAFGRRPWCDGGVFEGGSLTDDIEQNRLPLKIGVSLADFVSISYNFVRALVDPVKTRIMRTGSMAAAIN